MPNDALTFNTAARWLGLESTLDQDKVAVTALNGTDFISAPFVHQIELLTALSDSEVQGLLGQRVTVWLDNFNQQGDRRPINGLIRRLTGPTAVGRDLNLWRAEIVPQLAFLDLSADCQIFEEKSIPDIIEKVLKDHGLTSFEMRGLLNTYPPLEYCVQYRETAFNFVSRLMEQVGLFYWHEHSDGDHKLIISDSNQMASPALAQPALQPDRTEQPDVTDVTQEFTFHSGKWTLNDYDFEKPTTSLEADTTTIQTAPVMTSYEIYDYPGLYLTKDQGAALVRRRIEHEEANFRRVTGTGRRPVFDAGKALTIQPAGGGAPADADKLLLVQVHHIAFDTLPMNDAGAAGRARMQYENRFIATTLSSPFRPDRTAPKPFVRGVQTAVVTGPSGETIYTDKYGRVKVRFFWDRNTDGRSDDTSSCWIRVSQVWADNTFGAIHLPRIGEEVIVDFLEGDPDRPIITGRVYNGRNMVPYALPANKTQSGFKSRSIPGSGHNEFRFEDKGGSEQIYLHAQKDLDVAVEHDESRTIGHDQTERVKHNLTQTVDGTLTQTVTGAVSETYKNTLTQTVTGAVSETYSSTLTQKVTGAVTQNYAASLTQVVVGGITITTPVVMTVTATGGYNLIAPTSAWQTGPQSLSAYGFVFAAMGQQVQTIGSSAVAYGMNLQVIGVNLQVNGVTETISVVHFEDINAIELKTVGVYLKNAATAIKNAALHLFT